MGYAFFFHLPLLALTEVDRDRSCKQYHHATRIGDVDRRRKSAQELQGSGGGAVCDDVLQQLWQPHAANRARSELCCYSGRHARQRPGHTSAGTNYARLASRVVVRYERFACTRRLSPTCQVRWPTTSSPFATYAAASVCSGQATFGLITTCGAALVLCELTQGLPD